MPGPARRRRPTLAPAALLGAVALTLTAAPPPAGAAARRPVLDKALVERWMATLSNWGRWGKGDELGALNLITPAKRREAMALATRGIVVSMARKMAVVPPPPDQVGDTPLGVAFYEVHFKTMGAGDPPQLAGFTSEVQRYAPHGYGTHIDALCHDSDGKGRLYNGYDIGTIDQKTGCGKLGMGLWTEGIVTRGVLVDMTRLKGGRARRPGDPVLTEDIEAWERQAGLRVSPGDALFVYNPFPPGESRPTLFGRSTGGIDLTVLPWMKARGVALTGGFAQVPGAPLGGQVPGIQSADHRLALVAMGMPLLDGPELSELAEVAARQHRWTFLFTVVPVPAPGSTGQVVNPLAMF